MLKKNKIRKIAKLGLPLLKNAKGLAHMRAPKFAFVLQYDYLIIPLKRTNDVSKIPTQ